VGGVQKAQTFVGTHSKKRNKREKEKKKRPNEEGAVNEWKEPSQGALNRESGKSNEVESNKGLWGNEEM